jgi:hypothetical protein
VFTITGEGADALVGTVTAGGEVTSVANVAVGGSGWLIVTIGSKSTPQIPVTC